MAIDFHRTAISIHEDTYQELEAKSKETGRNLSWVADSSLTRYFSILESGNKKLKDKGIFSKDEMEVFTLALRRNFNNLRNVRMPQLRMMVRGMEEESIVPRELASKILDLPTDEFLALIEQAEAQIRK